jgi:DNA-binding NarL/FixJ family response regulator
MTALRVLLADDHLLVRAGIRSLLQGMDDLQIVAEADNGRQALALAIEHKPDLVIMDIRMNELNGIDATARIRAECPATRVIILSMHATEEFVKGAIKAGASGYLVKDSAPLELKFAIEAARRDDIYLSPRISRHVIPSLLYDPAGESHQVPIASITSRQREILQMIAEGKTTKEIAFILDVSVKTVETHRTALMDRLRIHDLAGLVVYAIRTGLIDIDQERS